MNLDRRHFLESCGRYAAALVVGHSIPSFVSAQNRERGQADETVLRKIVKSNQEWKRILSPEQYHVTREAGTEPPYSSSLLDVHEDGTFKCVCCDLPLFSSKTKFDSQTGWPSFWAPIAKRNVVEKLDNSLWETRTEVLCARCDAHLGHVFDDGPKPTGLRYCMNGVALKFGSGIQAGT